MRWRWSLLHVDSTSRTCVPSTAVDVVIRHVILRGSDRMQQFLKHDGEDWGELSSPLTGLFHFFTVRTTFKGNIHLLLSRWLTLFDFSTFFLITKTFQMYFWQPVTCLRKIEIIVGMIEFGCLERPLAKFFHNYGAFVSRHPFPFIAFPVLITLYLSTGLFASDYWSRIIELSWRKLCEVLGKHSVVRSLTLVGENALMFRFCDWPNFNWKDLFWNTTTQFWLKWIFQKFCSAISCSNTKYLTKMCISIEIDKAFLTKMKKLQAIIQL